MAGLTDLPDFIVVGSGCTGAMAAQTLVEGGGSVLMLDGGQRDTVYAPLIPDQDFVTVRRTDPQQHRYLLGHEYEGIPIGHVGTGAQLTPPRRFMTRRVADFLPIASDTFFPMESLARGGLGSGWGLSCCVFSEPELRLAGMDGGAMRAAYAVIADRIGISGERDDVSSYTVGALPRVQKAFEPDGTMSHLLSQYDSQKNYFRARDLRMGRPALALLTEPREGRSAASGRNLDFYSDADRAAYRPSFTVDALEKQSLFSYRGGLVVLGFSEEADGVTVRAIEVDSGQERLFRARRLVLGSGTLGTARIVMRSVDRDHFLPLLCNPYYYVPCLVPARFGSQMSQRGLGFAQAALFHDPGGRDDDVAMASIYTYRELMLFRLLKEAPLGFADARPLLRFLVSALVIMGVHHPDGEAAGKRLSLVANPGSPTGDSLSADCRLSEPSLDRISQRNGVFRRAVRRIGAWAIKQIDPGYGSSIHYAGTLPFDDRDVPFHLTPTGRLGGTSRVFVADGSGFKYLPAKSLTLSLMANAHLVAREALKQ